MSFKDRENSILEFLQQNREATIDELCARLFVSAPTMRRDLKALADSGKIIRTSGGAVFNSIQWEGTPQELREIIRNTSTAALADCATRMGETAARRYTWQRISELYAGLF
jgi:DeoR/GlpR family transcriptional regulator of sugar metabolism